MHVEVVYGMDTQHLPILVAVGIGTSNSPQRGAGRTTTLFPTSTSRRDDLPPSIKRRLRRKRRLHKLWTRTRCPKLKKEINDLSRKISKVVRDFRGATWETTIDRAHTRTCTRSKVWRIHDRTNGHFGEAETAKAIFRLPKRKAPEPDGISTAAIKQLPRRAMVAMTRLFNGILRTVHFPGCWKMRRVIAIPKAGKDPRLASSQRPITLLSHIAKLFERIMLRRLLRHLTPRQEQFGFRTEHSTTLQLARVLHHMAVEHDRGPHRWNLSRYREGVQPSVALRTIAQTSEHPDPTSGPIMFLN
ncbi:Probable RNA-directed DNA polymerase from transposon X-element [Eumeta japonica]|uniref:Probable RNA-directed DNA polymerase from transposon X-element n=1 Tax=Eumeta variegata TaxID=151549 RepID=A0A4C1WGF3_EUMVA|nr:Probable RNA-directed DNA polymerase from transposon X-element [Eumeta japonica]